MINIEGKDITQIFYQNKIINHVYYSGEPLQLIEDVDYKTGWANAGFSYNSVRDIKIGETSFTPVKLLRDIPSFLAYDNKIHRAGESGMINSTTGKFHGKYETGEGGTVLAHNGEVI